MNICTSTHQTPQAPRLITGELSLMRPKRQDEGSTLPVELKDGKNG